MKEVFRAVNLPIAIQDIALHVECNNMWHSVYVKLLCYGVTNKNNTYLCVYISATVPPGTPGRVRVIVWCWILGFLMFYRDPGPVSRAPFVHNFWGLIF